MKLLISLVSLVAFAAASYESDCDANFALFKSKYGITYPSVTEEVYRHSVFCESMKRVDEKNALNGAESFGITKFSDRTIDEFTVLLGRGQMKGQLPKSAPRGTRKFPTNAALSSTSAVNWAQAGKVTPVKNQGQCGSCWAFSAAEQVESAWAMAGNPLWEFSAQQIASCTTSCRGCGGGFTEDAYDYINSTVGLGSAWFAPYIQSMYESCSTRVCTEQCKELNTSVIPSEVVYTGPYATVTGYEYATPPCTDSCASQDLDTLAANVLVGGPASVCVNAASWNDYTGGILTAAACGGYAYNDLDHCVQLTGFNATAGYWLVKNSWATNWGVDGYILLEFGNNTCGIADEATFVTLGNA